MKEKRRPGKDGTIRTINEVELYKKAEEAQMILFLPKAVKGVSNVLPTKKGIKEFAQQYQQKQSGKPFSSDVEDVFHATTSKSYQLKEYQKNGTSYINTEVDRLVMDWGKGFEAEVAYKEVWNIVPVKNKEGVVELLKTEMSITIFGEPLSNPNYGKEGAENSGFKYLQKVTEIVRDGTSDVWKTIEKTVGVNPRDNSRTE